MGTPFSLRLPRCTVEDLRAGAALSRREQEARHPRYRVRVDDDVLLLKHLPRGRFPTPWTLRARIEQTAGGVRLTGTIRNPVRTVAYGLFTLGGVGLTVLGAVILAAEGPSDPGGWTCLVGGLLLTLVSGGVLVVGALVENAADAADAARVLRTVFVPPEQSRGGLLGWIREQGREAAEEFGPRSLEE